MEPKNFQRLIVDNFKTVHQSLSDTASSIPWSDLWADGRTAALKVYSTGARAYTSTSQWVCGVDWAKHWTTAENIASLIADVCVIAYAAAKPLAIASYKATKAWVKKVDWLDVLEIMVVGFIHFVQGVYEAGVKTGQWVHGVNDALAREFVYLTGALERPAAAAPTAPVTTATEPQGNEEVQSSPKPSLQREVEEVREDMTSDPAVAQAYVDFDAYLDDADPDSINEVFTPSDEDQASNPFIDEAVNQMMEEVTEKDFNQYDDQLDVLNINLANNTFTKVEDSTCTPAQHPLYAQLESMTVKQLREVSGMYNKQIKKEDLINAAAIKLAC